LSTVVGENPDVCPVKTACWQIIDADGSGTLHVTELVQANTW
jgi:hypothetical protein